MKRNHKKFHVRKALKGLWDRNHEVVKERFEKSAVLFRVECTEPVEERFAFEKLLSSQMKSILELAGGLITSLEEPCWILLRNDHDNLALQTRTLEPFSERRFLEWLDALALPQWRASQDGINELAALPESGRWLLLLREEPGFETTLQALGPKEIVSRFEALVATSPTSDALP